MSAPTFGSTDYATEVLDAGVLDYERDIEGYGRYAQRYLLCLIRETQRDVTTYAVTVWNATAERPLLHLGGRSRYVTPDEHEARTHFGKCLYPGGKESA